MDSQTRHDTTPEDSSLPTSVASRLLEIAADGMHGVLLRAILPDIYRHREVVAHFCEALKLPWAPVEYDSQGITPFEDHPARPHEVSTGRPRYLAHARVKAGDDAKAPVYVSVSAVATAEGLEGY